MSDEWSATIHLDLAIVGGVVIGRLGGHEEPTAGHYDIGIVDGRVAAIGDLTRASAEATIDANGGVVLPGFVNGHMHSYTAPYPGHAAGGRLAALIARARGQVGHHSDDARYVAAKWSAIRMLKSGITTVLDQPAQGVPNPRGTAEGYIEAGIRAFVAPMVSDLGYEEWLPNDVASPGNTARDPEAIVSSVSEFVSWLANTSNRVRPAVGPFAPGVCSDRLLVALAGLAREHDLPIHTHLDEAPWQRDRAFEKYGVSSVRRLAELDLLQPMFSMAHAVWIDDDDASILASNGCSIVHNPLSNLLLGNGIARVAQARSSGVNVALGSDGINAGCTFDYFEHMRLAAGLMKMGMDGRMSASAESIVLGIATMGGAAAVGMSNDIGRIVEGARADLAIVRPSTPQELTTDSIVRAIIFGGSAADVTDVVVDGVLVVRDGRATTVDEDELEKQVLETFARKDNEPCEPGPTVRLGRASVVGNARY